MEVAPDISLSSLITEKDWPGLLDMPEYQNMKRLDLFVRSPLFPITDRSMPFLDSQIVYPIGANRGFVLHSVMTFSSNSLHTIRRAD